MVTVDAGLEHVSRTGVASLLRPPLPGQHVRSQRF